MKILNRVEEKHTRDYCIDRGVPKVSVTRSVTINGKLVSASGSIRPLGGKR